MNLILDLCCLNDGGEFDKSFQNIYPDCLALKCEHRGTHATFLDIDITLNDGIFIYKLFDKRDEFPFNIIRMPDFSSNIPSYVFYGTCLSEFLRIARATLLWTDFVPRAVDLSKRMLAQGGVHHKIILQFKKAMLRHPVPFHSFQMTSSDMIRKIIDFS